MHGAKGIATTGGNGGGEAALNPYHQPHTEILSPVGGKLY